MDEVQEVKPQPEAEDRSPGNDEQIPDTPVEPVQRSQSRSAAAKNAALTVNIYSWATPLVGIIMLVVGLLAGYFGRPLITGQSGTAETAAGITSSSPAQVADLPPANASAEEMMAYLTSQVRHFKGDVDAPVTIIEFSDYKCPYCAKFAADSEPLLNENYIDEGLVRFGYWHVAFLGPESQWAAEAAECAAEQDAFWDYHALLFEKSNAGLGKDNLKDFARSLDLNGDQFDECLDSGRYTDTVQTDTALAQQIGANSTPAFLINGQPVLGAQPYEVFQQVIDQELTSQN